MISQTTIDEVKNRANLVDIVSEYVTLKRQGSGFSGCCPFHNEKTPSFHVREHEQYFHCFGCGKSGNIFSFLMEIKGLSFPEAIEELAQRYDVIVQKKGDRDPKEPKVKKEEIFGLNHLAQEFFVRTLLTRDPKIVEYIHTRDIKKKGIEEFGVGFAPLQGNELTRFLKKKRVADELLVISGLSRRNSRGELYDALRGRLVFPIFIDKNRIAGFGGRIIPGLADDSHAPKYLNSPETPVYQKSKILYGLPHALNDMKKQGEAYVVEGYLDVIGLWQVGVTNTVATCGTALTMDHVKRLSRLVKRVGLLFDGDSAGRAAAAKSFVTFLNAEIDVWALFLDEGEDPDSIAKKYGPQTGEYLQNLEKVSLLDAYLTQMLQTMGVTEMGQMGSALLGQLCRELSGHLKNVKDVIVRDSLITRAASRLRVPKERLVEVVETGNAQRVSQAETLPKVEDSKIGGKALFTSLALLDQSILLAAMAEKKEVVDALLKTSVWNEVLNPQTMMFVEGLKEALQGNEEAQKDRVKILLQSYDPSWTAHWRKAHEMLNSKTDFKKMYLECLRDAQKKRKQKDLESLRSRVEEALEDSEKITLLGKVVELERELRAL